MADVSHMRAVLASSATTSSPRSTRSLHSVSLAGGATPRSPRSQRKPPLPREAKPPGIALAKRSSTCPQQEPMPSEASSAPNSAPTARDDGKPTAAPIAAPVAVTTTTPIRRPIATPMATPITTPRGALSEHARPPTANREPSSGGRCRVQPSRKPRTPIAPTQAARDAEVDAALASLSNRPRQGPVDWAELCQRLPTGNDSTAMHRRHAAFERMDADDSGHLSLAEADLGVREILGMGDVYHDTPIMLRAFEVAKGHANVWSTPSDFIERSEFRSFLLHLRQFFALHCALGARPPHCSLLCSLCCPALSPHAVSPAHRTTVLIMEVPGRVSRLNHKGHSSAMMRTMVA